MIHLKSAVEIELIRESALLVSRTLAEVAKAIKPGVATLHLDKIAEEFIFANQAVPAFKDYGEVNGYGGFPNTLCISVNEYVVHGLPSQYELKEGDIVSVDCGVLKNGYYGDSAYTFPVGEISEEAKNLLEVTKQCLLEGIEQVKIGGSIGDIGYAIQTYAERKGFSVVRDFVGHGIGKELHEDPQVANYGIRNPGKKIQDGLVIAIEPMINAGGHAVSQLDDGWTVRTQDGSLSAHFEHTVAVTKTKERDYDILSSFDELEKVLEGRKGQITNG